MQDSCAGKEVAKDLMFRYVGIYRVTVTGDRYMYSFIDVSVRKIEGRRRVMLLLAGSSFSLTEALHPFPSPSHRSYCVKGSSFWK